MQGPMVDGRGVVSWGQHVIIVNARFFGRCQAQMIAEHFPAHPQLMCGLAVARRLAPARQVSNPPHSLLHFPALTFSPCWRYLKNQNSKFQHEPDCRAFYYEECVDAPPLEMIEWHAWEEKDQVEKCKTVPDSDTFYALNICN